MSKIMHHLIDEFYIDKKALMRVQKLAQTDRKTRIVFMPIYRSYVDGLVLHYINYLFDIEPGFTFGCYEDTPQLLFVK